MLIGTKVFTLLPPCDVWRLHLGSYPAARWHQRVEEAEGTEASHPSSSGWQAVLREPEEEVAWCPIDPRPPSEDLEQHRRLFPHFFDDAVRGPMVAEVGPMTVGVLTQCSSHTTSGWSRRAALPPEHVAPLRRAEGHHSREGLRMRRQLLVGAPTFAFLRSSSPASSPLISVPDLCISPSQIIISGTI